MVEAKLGAAQRQVAAGPTVGYDSFGVFLSKGLP